MFSFKWVSRISSVLSDSDVSSMSATHALFQFPRTLYFSKLQSTTGIIDLVSLRALSTVSYRKWKRFFNATCGAKGWICGGKLLQVPCEGWWGVSVKSSCEGIFQQRWKLSIEEGASSGGSPAPRRLLKLCSLYSCCAIKCWTGIEHFLLCRPHWWWWPGVPSVVWNTVGRTSGEGVAERRRGGGVPGWLSVFHASEAPNGAVVHEKSLWPSKNCGVLLSPGWFPSSPVFV